MSCQDLLKQASQRDVDDAIDDSDLVSMRYTGYGITSKPLPVPATWQRSSMKPPPMCTVQSPTGAKRFQQFQEATAESKAIDFDDEWSRQYLFLDGSLIVENPTAEVAHRLYVKAWAKADSLLVSSIKSD